MTVRTRAALAAATAAAVAGAGLVALVAVAPVANAASPKLSLSRTSLGAHASDVRITVTGQDYLVPPHAEGTDVFGGVYVFFGWVKPGGTWGPSNRNSHSNKGTFGVTYSYPGEQGDAGTRDGGDGAIRFVSFTDAGLSGDATPYHMDEDGNWTAHVTVPGPTYTYRDADGTKQRVDCREVTCGVYTIGAHGKASATNEVFTPIRFASTRPEQPEPTRTAEPSPSRSAKPKTTAPSKAATPSKTAKSSASAKPSRSGQPSASATPSSTADASTSATPAVAGPDPSPAAVALADDLTGSDTPGAGAGVWALVAVVGVAAAGTVTWLVRRGRRMT
jgi:hypothetical protein